MPRLLKDLQINDVSSVDRGAGVGVKVVLMKRDEKNNETKDKHDADNVIDMRGLLHKEAIDFDAASDNIEARETASQISEEMNECICALNCAICSIMDDPAVTDKNAAISESFNQFKDYIAGLTPANMEKAMNAEVTKQINEAVAAALKDTNDKLAKLETDNAALVIENAVLKLSPAEQDYCKAFPAADKKKFADKKKEDREEEMEDAKKRAAVKIDPEIQKRLERAEANDALLKALIDKDETATFAKRAVEIGQTEAFGAVLRKAHNGDKDALKQVEGKIEEMAKALVAAQKTGKIFKEFGTAVDRGGVTANEELMAKAEELRKTESGKALSPQQAFAKVYADPANAELVSREKQERNSKMGVAA